MSATCTVPATAPAVTRRFSSLTRGGTLALSMRILGAAGMFLCHIVLARSLGPAGFKEYSLAVVWVQILCVFGKLGLDNTSLRYVSEYVTKNETARLKGFLRVSTRMSLIVSSMIAFGFAVAVMMSRNTFGPSLTNSLLWASLMIPLVSLRQIQEASLRGFDRLQESQIGSILWPLILFVLAGVAWWSSGFSLLSTDAVLLHLISVIAVSLLVYSFLKRATPFTGSEPEEASYLPFWRNTALAFLAAELLVVLKSRISVAIAGAMLSESDGAGLYSAMERFADVTVLGCQAVGLVIAPQFASLYAAGRFADMRRLMIKGRMICVGFTLPVALGVFCFGDLVFLLIGPEYRPGGGVLNALLIAACIASFAGPAAYCLQMTGRERTMLLITGIGAVVNVISSLILVRPWGIMGLGVAQIVTSFIWTAGILISVRFHPAWQPEPVTDAASPCATDTRRD